MAIRTSKEVKQATHIAMTWVILSPAAAVAVGMVGRVWFDDAARGTVDSRRSFRHDKRASSRQSATGLIPGRPRGHHEHGLFAAPRCGLCLRTGLLPHAAAQGRRAEGARLDLCASVLVIAIFLGHPNNFILDMSYAWAGFGAAFGPALLMSLFGATSTKYGVLVGASSSAVSPSSSGSSSRTLRFCRTRRASCSPQSP